MRLLLSGVLFLGLLSAHPAHCAEEPSVTLGILAAMSGEAASLGEECSLGFRQALDQMAPNGHVGRYQLKVKWADHRSEGKTAVTEFRRLTETEHASLVLSHHSQPSMQVNPLSAAQSIPFLGVVAQKDFISGNPCAYRFWPSVLDEARLLASVIMKSEAKRLAIVSVQNEYALSLKDTLTELLAAQRLVPVLSHELLPEDMSFQSVALRLKSVKADAVLINASLAQIPPMVRVLKEQRVKALFFGNVWFGLGSVRQAARDGGLDDIAFASPIVNQSKADSGSALTTTCYAAAMTALEAISRAQIPSPAGVLSALRELKAIRMADGTSIPIRTREAIFPMELRVYKDGQEQPLN